MGWWERQVVPRIVDKTLGTEDAHAIRTAACAAVSGRVLEIGFGSGLNLRHLPPSVTEVAAVEPNDTAWRLAGPRIEAWGGPVTRAGLTGEHLDEPDESFDHVLLTFVLCTIPNPGATLREARRVLRPGGQVHFAEHGRAPEEGVHRWQRRLEPVQRRLAGGCHLTREPVRMLEAADLRVTDLEASYLPGPGVTKPFSYVYRGRARK